MVYLREKIPTANRDFFGASIGTLRLARYVLTVVKPLADKVSNDTRNDRHHKTGKHGNHLLSWCKEVTPTTHILQQSFL